MFEIRFQGVMTFAYVEDASGNYVCRVPMYEIPIPHPLHRRVLTVSTDDLATRPDTQAAAVCYELEGLVTTDLLAGIPENNLQLLLGVDELIELPVPAPKPDPNIGRSVPTAEFPTLVELAAGTLTIGDWFYETAVIDGAAARCVARTVRFTAAATRDVTITIHGGSQVQTVVLKPDAVVHMTNLPVVPVDHSHHQVMINFFEPPAGSPRPLHKNVTSCDRYTDPEPVSGCITGRDFSVECANTRFP
jgi:hypothetical protein